MKRVSIAVLQILLLCRIGWCAHGASAAALPEGFSGRVELQPTDRIPGARGEAKIQREPNHPAVELGVAQIKPATLFGGDFNTFVVWTITADGAHNAGELVLEGSRAQIVFPAPTVSFALLVTAEPHYLVWAPSRFVVLETAGQRSISYSPDPTPYNYKRSTLDRLPGATGKVRSDVSQAITAVRLAHRAGAHLTRELEFSEALRSLQETLRMARLGTNSEDLSRQARDTVKLAVRAYSRGVTIDD